MNCFLNEPEKNCRINFRINPLSKLMPNWLITFLDDPEEQKLVRQAMDFIESKTCIKFVIREEQTEYISINREKVRLGLNFENL